MTVALIDNGSLEPAAHLNLRAVAAELASRAGCAVQAVSWKHSDRIAPAQLDNARAWTLLPFVRDRFAAGERNFRFVPFFISAQGAIGSALRGDLENLQADLGPNSFDFSFTAGLFECGVVAVIVADCMRRLISERKLELPPVVVVDHGGPSARSAALRNDVATQVHAIAGGEVGPVTGASMEGSHPPLLAHVLDTSSFVNRDVVVAPLFLSPGRHAGPGGDIAQICAASRARCHVTDLVGTHPRATEALAEALRHALSNHPAPSFV